MLPHVLMLHALDESSLALRSTGVTFLDGTAVRQRAMHARLDRDRVVKFHSERHVLGLKNPRMPPAPASRLAMARSSGRIQTEEDPTTTEGWDDGPMNDERGLPTDGTDRRGDSGANQSRGGSVGEGSELGPDLHSRSQSQRGTSPPIVDNEPPGRATVLLRRTESLGSQ